MRRNGFDARLAEALVGPLTLVRGGAGWEGSALVAAALARGSHEAVWCACARIHSRAGLAAALRAGLAAHDASDGRANAPLLGLLRELAESRAVLVMDGVHHLDPPCATFAAELLRSAPNGLRVVLTSRGRPPLPLERLLHKGREAEGSGSDLALSDGEADRILDQLGSDGVPAAVTRYLEEEVIGRLGDRDVELLEQLSLVDRFDADLADALTGGSGTAPALARLVERDILACTGTGARRVYHPHPLLRSALQARVARTQQRERAAASPAPSQAVLITMGRLALVRDGQPVPVSAFRRHAARELLALLCASRGPVHREFLLEALWPGTARARALSALHSSVYCLRRALSADGLRSPAIVVDGELYDLELGPRCALDVEVFLAAARAGLTSGEPPQLARAEAAYGGPFLPEWPYADWAQGRRVEVDDAHRRVVEAHAQRLAAAGVFEDAIDRYRLLIALEPEGERWHRGLMTTYACAGERALAVRQFHRCRDLLRERLGLEPCAATQALYRRLLVSESDSSDTPQAPALAGA